MRRFLFASGGRRTGFALLLYTMLALALTWPLAAHFTTHVTGDGIDDPSLVWNLWWLKLRLVDQLNPDIFHSGWMFHPVNINLAFYTLTPLNGLLSIPLQVAFDLTPANNLLLLSAFVLSGLGVYLLVRQLLQIWGWHADPAVFASLLAGAIYAFASAKLFYAALGQFNIASSQWIPFCILYLVRMVTAANQRNRLTAAALAGLFLVLQAWAELTYASFLLIFIGLLFVWMLLSAQDWQARLRGLLPFGLIALLFVIGISPFLAAMAPDLAAEGDFFGRGGGFAADFSADLQGYLVPTRLHPWIGEWVAGLGFPNDKGQHIYVGYSVFLLALLGAWALWRGGLSAPATRRWFWFWVPATALFWLLTLGPQVRWGGQPLPLAGPFALVSRLPFFSGNRYPSRYSVMLLLALAMLAGAGVYWLFTRRWLVRHRRGAAALSIVLAALLLVEHISIPLPLSEQSIPPLYGQVAAAAQTTAADPENTGVLLELPTGWRNGARVLGKSDLLIMAQLRYQTEHGLRRLGGNTSRNPEFKFQYFTDAPLLGDLIALFNAGQSHMTPVIDSQLDDMIARNRPIAAQVLDFLGVEFITVHVQKSPPQLLRFVEAVLPLTLVDEESTTASDGSLDTIRLYRMAAPHAAPAAVQIAMDGPLANLYLGEGWSPAVPGAGVRYATRSQPVLLLDLPAAGGSVRLEWAAPAAIAGATVNGAAAEAIALDSSQLRWEINVPPGAAARPVDHMSLQLEGPGVAAGEAAAPEAPTDGWRVGETGSRLPAGVSLLLRSAGQEAGDFAHIWLDGVDVAGGGRGYNLAALDAAGQLLGQATFDTFATAQESQAMATWLRSWPSGTVIAGAVRDEASLQLTQEAVDALAATGVTADLRGKFRWGHAFVGAAGAAYGTALESAELLRPAVAFVGAPVDGERVYGQLQGITIQNK